MGWVRTTSALWLLSSLNHFSAPRTHDRRGIVALLFPSAARCFLAPGGVHAPTTQARTRTRTCTAHEHCTRAPHVRTTRARTYAPAWGRAPPPSLLHSSRNDVGPYNRLASPRPLHTYPAFGAVPWPGAARRGARRFGLVRRCGAAFRLGTVQCGAMRLVRDVEWGAVGCGARWVWG
eukprot:gene14864-biopygen603